MAVAAIRGGRGQGAGRRRNPGGRGRRRGRQGPVAPGGVVLVVVERFPGVAAGLVVVAGPVVGGVGGEVREGRLVVRQGGVVAAAKGGGPGEEEGQGGGRGRPAEGNR